MIGTAEKHVPTLSRTGSCARPASRENQHAISDELLSVVDPEAKYPGSSLWMFEPVSLLGPTSPIDRDCLYVIGIELEDVYPSQLVPQ